MTAVAHVRQREARDAKHTVDIRVQHAQLVVFRRLGERRPAERQPCVVEQDVDAPELAHGGIDERLGAALVGDVECERDIGLDPVGAPRTTDAADPCLPRLAASPHRSRRRRP